MTSSEATTAEPHGMVIGVDGSEASRNALAWAAPRTDRFGPLRPVHAWDYPLAVWAPTPFGPGAAPPSADMEAAARAAAEDCLAEIDAPREETVIERGDPGTILVEHAADARVLVVGTRSRGPVRSNMLGSVGRHCADHSPAPLVIVPVMEGRPVPERSERIVVGVDGSDTALAALRWAITIAPEEAEISAVTAWQTPVDGPILYGVNRFDIRALKAAAETTVIEAADAVCAELAVPHDRVIREIAEGDPRWVLHSKAEDADLLVLGRRGRSGLPHFFLGSATTALIHRPTCPTAVIPG